MAAANYVITGASSDLGTALAKYLDSNSDAEIVLVARHGELPRLQRPHLQLSGLDLSIQESLAVLRQGISKQFSAPFVIVHCVGDFWTHKPFVRTEFQEIAGMINSHYLTLCGVAWALLPLLIKYGGGRLIALSCNSVAYNYPDMAPFTAAKAAVESFIKCIANEYSEFNITANALALPTVLTEKVLKLKKNVDPEHYLTPEEVAKIIAETLATASSVLNGNTIKIYRHSPTFFNKSYFERNPREPEMVLVSPEHDCRP